MKHKPLHFQERLEKYLLNLIQNPEDQGLNLSRGERALLIFLRGASRLYRGIVQARLWLYHKRILHDHMLGCQVISVGNLTVGGTGKTPVVEVLARELTRKGRKVAILSRGYKKVEPGFLNKLGARLTMRDFSLPPRIVSDGKQLLLDSAMSGDEPYMLATNLPDVVVLVDRDRVKSGRYAINHFGCDTLILDDGFQYLKLNPRVQIVLVDKTNPFGNEEVLPRGLLREPVRNIRRADVIFITKSDGTGTEPLRRLLRKYNPRAEMIECRHCSRYLQAVFTRERVELSHLQGRRVLALSGIAVPRSFESELERWGAILLDRVRFADHHRYSQQEIIDIINRAAELGAECIMTTEKDAVRFPRLDRMDVPIYFLRVDIDILSGEEDFHACISRICFG